MNGQIIKTSALDVFEHMALDEFLAENAGDIFFLRFYNWKHHAITFGYAQFYSEVKKCLPNWANDKNTCRRPTGGGVVIHEKDITFSCIFSCKEALPALKIYERLHSAIAEVFCKKHILPEVYSASSSNTQAYAPSKNGSASVCFKNPVSFDLISKGNKILGGAIRKFGDIILYQGSLNTEDARLKTAEIESVILKAIEKQWQVVWLPVNVDEKNFKKAKELANFKYKTSQWLNKF